METGTVNWFDATRGIGFIRRQDGSDLFVRALEIDMGGFRTLCPDQRVAFDVVDTEDGPEASRVLVLVDPPSDAVAVPREDTGHI